MLDWIALLSSICVAYTTATDRGKIVNFRLLNNFFLRLDKPPIEEYKTLFYKIKTYVSSIFLCGYLLFCLFSGSYVFPIVVLIIMMLIYNIRSVYDIVYVIPFALFSECSYEDYTNELVEEIKVNCEDYDFPYKGDELDNYFLGVVMEWEHVARAELYSTISFVLTILAILVAVITPYL